MEEPIPLQRPCKIEEHEWNIEIDGGGTSISPHAKHDRVTRFAMNLWANEENTREYYSSGRKWYLGPACEDGGSVSESFVLDMRVKVREVSEHTPSTPMGPEEWDYWIEPVEITGGMLDG